MFLQYRRSLIYHRLPHVWKASYTISASIFVDVPYSPPYSTDKFISCVVPVPRSGSFTLAKRSQSHGLRRKRRHLVVQNHIILHDNARDHTAATVTDLLHRWQLGNSGTSTVLTRYEYMRLQSLRQGPDTTQEINLFVL